MVKAAKTKLGKRPKAEAPPARKPAPEAGEPFPIVGIGASAGGLEALEQFLSNVTPGCNLAFVVIQHLDPTYKGIMPELLQRITEMKVFQVTDRMKIQPGCVYVIPPNREMSILHGVLRLFKPSAPRGLRLPIDFFLRSLAEDRKHLSIGVILSGMGSDGTIGLRAIKEVAGLTLAQEPTSAKFDSMPRSAISAGLADIVAPAEELPAKILGFLQHTLTLAKTEHPADDPSQSAMEKVVIVLRTRTGHDFSQYKKNTLYRRVERRMGIHQIDKISNYVRYLRENSQEVELLFKELLIGVTSFFRDSEAWEHLKKESLPALLANLPAGSTLRAWSTGCSTGEEAYTLAMLFKEVLDQGDYAEELRLQIFATDLDADAIAKARNGLYPANIAADVSAERLQRFFVREDERYRIGKVIREMVTFATQNLIMDPPFTKLDLLICRNLLIYLTPEMQKRLLPLFHYSLKPGGLLFLGSAETINSFSELFAPLHSKSRIFQRRETLLPAEPMIFPALVTATQPGVPKELPMLPLAANLQLLADQLLLQHYSPAAVLANNKGDIVYINGRTGKYLEPAAGKANWNLFVMAREGLRFELSGAFQRAVRQQETVSLKGLKVGTNGGTQLVDMTIQFIKEPEALRGMVLVVFKDVDPLPASKSKGRSRAALPGNILVSELERELQQAREELQTTREEMQSSQEELKSTNEELQSTNEELQSTNEELTTSREEMQSLNEELQTVNAEQQSKMDELTRTNNDMRNLLNSTEIITIFLDNDLHVRRFTTGANKLFKLLPGDVGRPLSDLSNKLNYLALSDDAQEVLSTLVFSEKQVTTEDGHWYSVRIMPYRTMDDMINGVVITFTDISYYKKLEAKLEKEMAEIKILKTKGSHQEK